MPEQSIIMLLCINVVIHGVVLTTTIDMCYIPLILAQLIIHHTSVYVCFQVHQTDKSN